MAGAALSTAHGLLRQAVAELVAASGPSADDDDLLSTLTVCEGAARLLEQLSVGAISDLQRRGVFVERGYRSTVTALTDLLGWDQADARRRLVVAEQAVARIGLDGTELPARLTATATVFAAGACSARHVEVIARVLDGAAARRLPSEVWTAAEAQLAAKAGDYSPADLHAWGSALVETLDQDGPEPDDRPPAPVNELFLTRNPDGTGGRLKGRFDVPTMFDAIAVVIDAHSAPLTADDGLRRAIAARDHGCARCSRPPSWCEIHHVVPWESGGPTSIDNCAMLCRACHRLVHHGGWDVHLRNGIPEFLPPRWIDHGRRPRSRPPNVIQLRDLDLDPPRQPVAVS